MEKVSNLAQIRRRLQFVLIGSLLGLVIGSVTGTWANLVGRVVFQSIIDGGGNLSAFLIFYTLGLITIGVTLVNWINKLEP